MVDGGVLLLEDVDGLFLLLDDETEMVHSFALLDETLESDGLGLLKGMDIGNVRSEGMD